MKNNYYKEKKSFKRKKARERYQNLCAEEDKKRQYTF